MDATIAEWQPYLQSIILGLIFSYLLAKLISIVVSFREDNLSLTRNSDPDYLKLQSDTLLDSRGPATSSSASRLEDYSVIAEQGSDRHDSDVGSDGDDDDWEGVESTELDEIFSAATAFVAATAADRAAHHKVPADVQLHLYGLYKISIEGPCTAPQPSALKMTARAKWQAWQKLGAMPPEDAMQKYIDIVTELFPSWIAGSGVKKRERDGEAAGNDGNGGPMGPVFSTFVYEEESEVDLVMDAIHDFAREGDSENLLKCIESGISVDHKDSEGRTPLHWAVDRGHHDIAELLITKNADVNAKDNEGQTPLHYAVVCERESIAEYLVKQNADTEIKDNEGETPSDICDLKWPCMETSR